MELSSSLSDVDFSNQFGSIKGEYRIEKGSLFVEQQLNLNKTTPPKEAIVDMITLSGSTSQLNIPTINFSVVGKK